MKREKENQIILAKSRPWMISFSFGQLSFPLQYRILQFQVYQITLLLRIFLLVSLINADAPCSLNVNTYGSIITVRYFFTVQWSVFDASAEHGVHILHL